MQKKTCPFLKENCIGPKCALWMSATVRIQGEGGDGGKAPEIDYDTCAFRIMAERAFRQIAGDVLSDYPGYIKWFD